VPLAIRWGAKAPGGRRVEDVVGFVRKWDGRGDILVHCSRGVSRSTAAAFVVMCLREPNTAEAALASRLRAAAPFADPCPLLIAYADALMGRGGRMIDAIEDLPPPIPTIRAPTVALPLS
jgi:predicted protein tyrosine phosphatase